MPDASNLTDPLQLSGWKEIAAYLRVSVRTAQKLEVQQGLPVRRGAGQKGPVCALPAELDTWRKRPSPLQTAPSTASAAAGLSNRSSRRQLLRDGLLLGSGGLLAAGLAASVSELSRMARRLPASYEIRGPVLSVYDAGNRQLWTHVFPEPIRSEVACAFIDVEGTGRRETLFVHSPAQPDTPSRLICFSADGSVLWEFIAGKSVRDRQGRQFVPPYGVLDVAIFRLAGSKGEGVVVSSVHNYSFACQLAVLNGRTGKVQSEYWHRGHLRHLGVSDIDGDGIAEILAGGVNDSPECKRATLLAFDPRDVSGATPHPNGGSYFEGMQPRTAKRTVFFPKSALCRFEEFNVVKGIHLLPQSIVITIAEGTDDSVAPCVAYEFDRELKIRNVLLEDSFQNRLLQLQGTGQLTEEATPDVIATGLKRAIVVR